MLKNGFRYMSPYASLCYQFLLKEALETLDVLSQSPILFHLEKKESSSNQVHSLLYPKESQRFPPPFSHLTQKVHRFLELEEGCFPTFHPKLVSFLSKLGTLIRHSETNAPAYMHILKELLLELAQAIQLFKEDAVVLFFFLRHHPSFDHHLGRRFTHQLLRSLFHGNIDQASAYIHKVYHEKGFDHLHPKIEKLMKHLVHE